MLHTNLERFVRRLSRRKQYSVDEDGDLIENNAIGTGPKLLRVLNLFDLTFLGIGSTLGVGIYVLAGSVAKDIAGPAVCISFLIAAFASGISAFCYAEFGARVPKAGSAYIYSYVTVGELIAFIIGWNLILEYLIGTASVARALSGNVDSMFAHRMSNYSRQVFPINIPNMSDFADWFAMTICLLMTVVLALGVKSSSIFTNIFTVLNLAVVLFVVLTGLTHVDLANWNVPAMNVTSSVQTSAGFMPFGVNGVLAGAAKCFFGFVGFDSIAAAGEEAKNPKRNVPLSIMLTLLVVLLAYVGVSTILTLMVPYYLQDKETPLVHAFQHVDQTWAAWIVVVGSTFGLTASLVGSLMPMPRIVYAMAKDGLLFRCLAAVHPKFKTPISATFLTGFCAAILAMITDLDSLVDMMSIGTLLAYTLVAVSILLLRYESSDTTRSNDLKNDGRFPWQKKPTSSSSKKSKIAIAILCFLIVVVCWLACSFQQALVQHFGLIILLTASVVLLLLVVFYLIWLPRSISNVYFMVPLVPVIPALSIFINVYLMFQLSFFTWMRFLVWMTLGFLVYGCYGISHSTMENEYQPSPLLELDDDLSPLVLNEEEM